MAAYSAPMRLSAIASVSSPANLDASVRLAGRVGEVTLVTWELTASVDEVDGREQTHPHDVDEVPVVGHHDGVGGLLWRERAVRGPGEHEQEGEKTADDVQAVEPGREVVDRA